MIDLSKLTPAPWEAMSVFGEVKGPWNPDICNRSQVVYQDRIKPSPQTDLEFIALARNAFDVTMRRPPQVSLVVYMALSPRLNDFQKSQLWCLLNEMENVDLFTAFVEADKWMTEQEKSLCPTG